MRVLEARMVTRRRGSAAMRGCAAPWRGSGAAGGPGGRSYAQPLPACRAPGRPAARGDQAIGDDAQTRGSRHAGSRNSTRHKARMLCRPCCAQRSAGRCREAGIAPIIRPLPLFAHFPLFAHSQAKGPGRACACTTPRASSVTRARTKAAPRVHIARRSRPRAPGPRGARGHEVAHAQHAAVPHQGRQERLPLQDRGGGGGGARGRLRPRLPAPHLPQAPVGRAARGSRQPGWVPRRNPWRQRSRAQQRAARAQTHASTRSNPHHHSPTQGSPTCPWP
jgi:hypothetical protein